jgi:hypothetical protein
LPCDQLESQIDDGSFGAAALDRGDQHFNRELAHLIAVGAHAGQAGDHRHRDVEIIEPGDAEILREAHAAALAFEQCADGDVVIVGLGGVRARNARQQLGQQFAAALDEGRLGRGDDQPVVQQARAPQRARMPLTPQAGAHVHLRGQKSDPATPLRDQMAGRGLAGVLVRENQQHVHPIGPQLHDMHHRTIEAFQHAPSLLALIKPGHRHRRGPLLLKQPEQGVFLQG